MNTARVRGTKDVHSRPLVSLVVDTEPQAIDEVAIVTRELLYKHPRAERPIVLELALLRASIPVFHDHDQGETLRSLEGEATCALEDLEAVRVKGSAHRLRASVVRDPLNREDLVVQHSWVLVARDWGAPCFALLLQVRWVAKRVKPVANDGCVLVVNRTNDEDEALRRERMRFASALLNGRPLQGGQLLVKPSNAPRPGESLCASFPRSSSSR